MPGVAARTIDAIVRVTILDDEYISVVDEVDRVRIRGIRLCARNTQGLQQRTVRITKAEKS